MLVRTWRNRGPDLGWWEWKLVSLLRKTICQFLQTLNTNEWPSDSIPRCTPEENENICPHRNLRVNVHSGISHNSQKGRRHQMSIDWWTKCGRSIQWDMIQQEKQMKYRYSLKNVISEYKRKRPHIIWFYLQEMSRTGKHNKNGLVVAEGWEEGGSWGWRLKSTGFFEVMKMYWS